MSYQRLFIKALADSLLVGDWHPQSMEQRINWLLQSKPSWVIPFTRQIHAAFQADFPDVTKNLLIDFIVNDPFFLDIWQQYRDQLHIRHYNLQQTPAPVAKIECTLPQLQNLSELASWLGLSAGQLANYAANWRTGDPTIHSHFQHYHYHWRKKHGGQQRLIEAPKLRMAAVQRQIYLGILDAIPLHETCHGFRKRHSCQSYVAAHAGKSVVIHMDLKNFFSSIPLRRIHALFTTLGYRESVARQLAGLCCHQTPIDILDENLALSWQQRKQFLTPHIPQGSPSSPALANLAAYKLDLRLAALAKKLGGTYTRYADDLAFSGDSDFANTARNIPQLVAHIALTEGFSVNHRKTRLMHQGVSQRLTGMTLNHFPNYPRKDYDRLKAILYNCVKFGPQAQNRKKHPHFKLHLHGKIAFVRSLNPNKADKLDMLFNRIHWN